MFDLIVLIFDTSINDEREVSQNETMAHAISEAVASIFLRLRKITLSFLERHNNSIVIAVEKKNCYVQNAHEYVKTFGAPKAFCV